VSILIDDMFAEENYVAGFYVGENIVPLLCRLEDGVVLAPG
jgi:hypothetical protein